MTKFPKTLLIFGAGASKGSEKDCSKQPPLGGEVFQLFSKKYYDTWGSICPESELGTIFLNDFEKGMDTLLQSNPSLASNCHKDLASGFFSFQPSKDNLYIKIAAHLKKSGCENFGIVTFNYERLLPLALEQNQIAINHARNSSIVDKIEVCFPHGICNLFAGPTFNEGKIAFTSGTSLLFKSGGSLQLGQTNSHLQGNISGEGNIIFATGNSRFQSEIKTRNPVMSFITENKQSHAGSNFIHKERARFEELVMHAEKIVIFGLRYQMHDIHIWESLLKSSAQDKLYCGGVPVPEGYLKLPFRFSEEALPDILNSIS